MMFAEQWNSGEWYSHYHQDPRYLLSLQACRCIMLFQTTIGKA